LTGLDDRDEAVLVEMGLDAVQTHPFKPGPNDSRREAVARPPAPVFDPGIGAERGDALRPQGGGCLRGSVS